MSRFEELKAAFRQRLLAAAQHHLFGHLEGAVSGYEAEIDRKRRLLDKLSEAAEKRREPEGQQLSEIKDDVCPGQKRSRPDHEDAGHAHVKEEHMERTGDGEDSGGSEPESDSGDEIRRQKRRVRRFSCSLCNKTYKQKASLQSHMRTHTGEKPYSCSVCGRTFKEKAGVREHMRTHTGEKPYSCSECGRKFAQKVCLHYHKKIHTGEKPFSCSVCHRRFRFSSQVRIHKCVVWNDGSSEMPKQPLSCPECEETFANTSLLMTHRKIHQGKKLLTCSVCGVQRQFSSQMEIHMRSHTGERPYSCSMCEKTFTQRGIMLQHMAVHSGVKPFSCTTCGQRFYWHFQIKKHKCKGTLILWRKAASEIEDPADIEFWKDVRQHQSGFTYKRKKKVAANGEHTEEKPAEPGSAVSCTQSSLIPQVKNEESAGVCSQLQSGQNSPKVKNEKGGHFCNQSSLIHEVKNEEGTDVKNEKSDELWSSVISEIKNEENAGFCTQSSLNVEGAGFRRELQSGWSHLNSAVDYSGCASVLNLPNFSDEASKSCAKQSASGSLLRQVKFSCSLCCKTFRKLESLQSHLPCHTRERSILCSVCNLSFSDRDLLIQHMRVHTMQTQFKCSVCGKEFAWRRHLMKHMEVHAEDGESAESSSTDGPAEDDEVQTEPEGHFVKKPESETDDSDFWTETRTRDSEQKQPSWAEDRAASDESVDSDFWKDTRKPQCSEKTDENEPSEQTFVHTLHLESPISSHRKEGTFVCSVCGLKCLYRSHLRIHMRTHTGEKPFSCPVCGRKYAHKASMQSHMEVHAQKSCYSCTVCEQSFTWFTELKYHQCDGALAHRIEPSKAFEAFGDN